MAMTLRHVRPDAAAKLRQLEVGAAAVDRAARDLIPAELRSQPKARLLLKRAVRGAAYLRLVLGFVRSSQDALSRSVPHVATALRTLRGLVVDAVFCVSLAFALLLASTLVVLILAPPA
jgi:hypothetical protein